MPASATFGLDILRRLREIVGAEGLLSQAE